MFREVEQIKENEKSKLQETEFSIRYVPQGGTKQGLEIK